MRTHSHTFPRGTRPLLALAAGAALLFSLTFADIAPAAKKGNGHARKSAKGRKASALPPSGIYDACSLSDPKNKPPADCGQRLALLREGGFRVVLNYWTAAMSIEDNLAYANTAQSLEMKLVWNLSNYRNVPLEQKVELVRATAAHPATWGYYIGDEVRPEERWQVAQLSTAVRSLTRKPLMFVSRPNPALMKPFRKLADYVGPDSYPVGPFDGPVCRTSRWASKMAPRNPVTVLQAYSWSIDYPHFTPAWPSGAQMRGMRNAATKCGRPKLIMWFCFHCITDYHPDPDSYWRELALAANGVSLDSRPRISAATL
jgi:hypothetical protein